MDPRDRPTPPPETSVTVRFWAGARAAVGAAAEVHVLPAPATLADVVRRVLDAHPGPDVARTIGVCSVLVGEDPVGGRDPAALVLEDGASVEFLPPFAGG